jgi:hypothetical protein
MPSVPDQAVPEPSTILGVGLSIGFGVIFKRKSNQARKKDDDDNQE